MKRLTLGIICLLLSMAAFAQKSITAESPNGRIAATVTLGDQLMYSINYDNEQVLEPSPLSLTLENGEVWGNKPKLKQQSKKQIKQTIASPFYRKSEIEDNYTLLTLTFKKGFAVEFRLYDDGVAYRFVSQRKGAYNITEEEVSYRFGFDATAIVPYVQVGTDGDWESQFHNSFENQYTTAKISELNKQRLMFLPLVVELGNGKKMCITESDLESYPGMYLSNAKEEGALSGVFAPYPKSSEQGGHNNLQFRVTERENYIAKVNGARPFPWRMAILTEKDADLAASDMTFKLAAPSRVENIDWIKPGKVAWDWWNDWNIDGVSFETGVNNETYKHYIDFAAANGIEYVILDEGWAVNLKADLMQVVPEIDLKELVSYANAKNVDLILWAGYHAFNRDMENVCRHYSEMGIKGFKVDFMDRDDQEMVDFNYRAAEMCAKYQMILDLHGMYKPAGLNRTYPNVLNFEGVFGLEQMKWAPTDVDQLQYDVMAPFIRQVAGPMDYTQGAMRNGGLHNYYPSNSEPMSQGTRCHQLALYVIFESPFNMLCDSPSNYTREPESLEYIAEIPTVWDETIVIDGKIGEYIVMARRSGDTWYVGGITNRGTRDLSIELSFLWKDTYKATLFKDGVNAHRSGRDYKKESFEVNPYQVVNVHLAPGGGFAMKIEK